MKIDGNEKEKQAMAAYHKGEQAEGDRLQNEFLAAFHEAYEGKDHCSCKVACRHHGHCRDCVVIHRAHQDHLPNCFRPMVNGRIRAVSELTEHTFLREMEQE